MYPITDAKCPEAPLGQGAGTGSCLFLPRSSKGSVLVASLWIIILLSLFSLALAQNARQKVTVYRHLAAKEQVRRMAESSIKEAIASLETRMADPSAKDANPVQADQTFYPEGGSVRVRIEDEDRKVNINKAEAYVLKNLIASNTHLEGENAERLAYAVVDYRDSDDELGNDAAHGSEAGAYRMAGLSNGPKNRDYEYLPEFVSVLGMSKELYLSMKDYITIYGNGSVNINTASREALLSLDLPEALANKIIAVRQGGAPGAGRGFYFSAPEKIRGDLLSFYPLTDQDAGSLEHAIRFGHLTTVSQYFRITAEVSLEHPKTTGRTECVYGIREGIKRWAEL